VRGSRRRVPTLALALALVGVLGLAGCSIRPKAEGRGPFLRIRRDDGPIAARRELPPGSVALALGGLPPEELTRLRECLAASTDAAVRRAAPMLFDVTGSDEDAGPAPDPLRQSLPDLPALTAAANVLGAPWHAPGVSVDLAPACVTSSSEGCVPLFAPVVDRDEAFVRRGRALAWSLGNAAALRAREASRASLLASLRRAQMEPSGTIALVFEASRGVLDGAKLEVLREEAHEAVAHLPVEAPQRPWLEALGDAPAAWALPVVLDPDEVLVVPRLSALARLGDFRAEVEAARASDRAHAGE
jgi:hypothetical protein